ncbi:hypothetical protein [Undibacterium sp. TS12]|uniref:hypothetical protein n=1 Tax=Undibacterium sp. TS12 TaxID=2908202 RepID=UPI001F4C9BAB|nr:hypothetical protein [Undibacterium sp. TS12]MCH8620416.1 hypothetical protein [Undibacterium sp. TS12]
MATLFAWTRPAFFDGFILDHTWVTDYDNRLQQFENINDVVVNGKNYWYSWGDYHKLGETPSLPDGFVCAEQGSISLANCLCLSNVPSKDKLKARGTIYNYGVEGVCHQLSNQILAATNSKLLVDKVRGYALSSFLFGDYGKNQGDFWKLKYAVCNSQPGSYRSDVMSFKEVHMDRHIDTFEVRARSVLSGKSNQHKLRKLLELRRAQQNYFSSLSDNLDAKRIAQPSASELNAKYNEFLCAVAELLGPESFQTLFDFPPGTKVKLVDEAQFGKAA